MAVSGYSAVVDRLITALGRLPGIGARSAERLAHYLLKCTSEEAIELADAIRATKEQIRHCQVCFHLTEVDQPICDICRVPPARSIDRLRRRTLARSHRHREDRRTFHGVYHVLLGRLAPLSGMGPEQLTIDALAARVASNTIVELIMATNPNLEGDGTALLIAQRLGGSGVRITRLARGLASGSTLEFANRDMLADAMSGRQPF